MYFEDILLFPVGNWPLEESGASLALDLSLNEEIVLSTQHLR
jgi:hypothetical protein